MFVDLRPLGAAYEAPPHATARALWLGGEDRREGGLRGGLDDVALWDRALSWQTVFAHARGSGA